MMKTEIKGWGNYPAIPADVIYHERPKFETINEIDTGIAFGLGRSYGDSALANNIYSTQLLKRFLNFDNKTGILACESGVSIAEILSVFANRGWFLPVTTGTKFVTIGGAIASDVHGKNHHVTGCISEFVTEIKLLGADGKVYRCSENSNKELFFATCGGMGLTGIILEAAIRLIKINSTNISVSTFKAANLKETFDLFEENKNSPYTVAWIDCLSKGERLGRSLLMAGSFMDDRIFNYSDGFKIEVPKLFPSFALNKLSVSVFNSLYYNRILKKKQHDVQSINKFFYPLDAIKNWNRIYGKKGFLQYQFVLPYESSYEGLKIILSEISKSGMGSFLSVLKLMGPENNNYLSFPMEGYTLALDFKIVNGIFEFLDYLDEIVVDHGGRIYLTKDARMSREIMEKSYPLLDKFRLFRENNSMKNVFESEQSKRLGL